MNIFLNPKILKKGKCENANADYTIECELNECLMVGKGAKIQGEDKKLSVLGNLFESFLGAVYLDLGMEAAKRIMELIVFPKIEFKTVVFFEDYKTKLQECIQAESRKSVEYKVISESGPSHNKTFEVIVTHEGTKLGKGIGKSKKDAEQKAAQDALNGWDPTNGAVYYFNPQTATNKWIWSRPLIKTIGKHRFCK